MVCAVNASTMWALRNDALPSGTEFNPNGWVAYAIIIRGGACTGRHSREPGGRDDFVRTFERQRP